MISLHVMCVTLFFIYSQLHVLRIFRVAVSDLLLAESGFLRTVFCPSTWGGYNISYMEVSLEDFSLGYHLPDQPTNSAIPLIPTDAVVASF